MIKRGVERKKPLKPAAAQADKKNIALQGTAANIENPYNILQSFIDSSDTPVFSVGRNYCYTSFNKSHAAVMKSLYGADIQLGKNLLKNMTVKVDREAAKKNIDRVLLKCEKVTAEAYSGDELLARHYFEVSHSPIINPAGDIDGVLVTARDITQRKQLEEAIVESEERYRTILEQMQDSYYEVDLAGNFTFVNESAGHTIGYSREEMLGRNYRLGVPEEDIKSIFAAYNEVYRTGKPNKGVIHRIHHKDGSVIFSEVSIDLNRNNAGEITGFKCVSRDVTERMKTGESLRESEERFRRLSENAPDIIYRYRLKPVRGFEYISPAAVQISGYTPEAFYADPSLAWKNVHPEDRDQYDGHFRSPESLRQPLALRWIHKDGHVIWSEEIDVPVYDANGEIIAYEGIVRDITARKQIEEALRESESQYRLLSEHTTDTIFLLDMDLKMIYHSPSGEKLRGFTPREIMEMPLEQTLTPESLKLASELFFEEIPRVQADPGYNPIRILDLEYSRNILYKLSQWLRYYKLLFRSYIRGRVPTSLFAGFQISV